MRGFGAGLRHIIDLQAAALIRRRLDTGGSICQNAVQRTGGDTAAVLRMDILNGLINLVHAGAGQCGQENNRGISHVCQITTDVVFLIAHGVGFLVLHSIPLVDNNDGCFTGFVNKACDFGILFGNTIVGINQDQTNIGTLNGIDGTHIGEFFDGIVHLALAAHTGGINEAILAGLVFKVRVDGIAGSTGHVGNNDALFAQNTVQQAGLAHIGLADDGDLDDIILFILSIVLGDIRQNPVQHIAGTVTVDCRGFKEIANTQRIELEHIGIYKTDGVTFVDGQTYGFAAFAQHGGNILVRSSDTTANIYHHDDGISQFNADFCLTAHEFQHFAVGVGLNTTGIHQREMTTAPFTFTVNAVTGNTGGVLHDGGTLTGQFIEEHGLAYVGAAHNGHQRFCHDNHFLS